MFETQLKLANFFFFKYVCRRGGETDTNPYSNTEVIKNIVNPNTQQLDKTRTEVSC